MPKELLGLEQDRLRAKEDKNQNLFFIDSKVKTRKGGDEEDLGNTLR